MTEKVITKYTEKDRKELKDFLKDECNVEIVFTSFTDEEFEDFQYLTGGQN